MVEEEELPDDVDEVDALDEEQREHQVVPIDLVEEDLALAREHDAPREFGEEATHVFRHEAQRLVPETEH